VDILERGWQRFLLVAGGNDDGEQTERNRGGGHAGGD
jgi:hypothetical protein